jgi:hypothetical protein
VYLDDEFSGGGGGPVCRVCKHVIMDGGKRIEFPTDPDGSKGMTGLYHLACSKPFESIARAMNMLGRGFGR